MNAKKIFSRFEEVRDIYIGKKISLIRKLFYYIDWSFAYLIHGASISDYFAYGFYKLRHNGRTEYITCRRHKKIQSICNSSLTDREICRNKIKFNQHFSDYIGREWLDVNEVNKAQFKSFFERHPVVFIKEIEGYCGIGIKKCISSECDIDTLYDKLLQNNHSHFILEEQITQHPDLEEFHPWSINTIRIVTIYDTVNDNIHIVNARLRMGNLKNGMDNFHAKGLCANIDVETGVICSTGYDKQNHSFIQHPITKKQIVGFQIPYWSECKSFVEKMARRLPTVRYIGWDVVIRNDGSCILIEGNDNADHDIQQVHNCGLWKQYKSIMKDLR